MAPLADDDKPACSSCGGPVLVRLMVMTQCTKTKWVFEHMCPKCAGALQIALDQREKRNRDKTKGKARS